MNAFSAVVASSAWVFCFVASVTKASHIRSPPRSRQPAGSMVAAASGTAWAMRPKVHVMSPRAVARALARAPVVHGHPSFRSTPWRGSVTPRRRAPGHPDWGLEAYGGAAVDPETRSQAIDGPRKLASAAVRGSVGPAEPASLRRVTDRQNGGNFDSGHASCSPASLLSKSPARASFRTRATPLEMDERFALSGAGSPVRAARSG